MNELEKLFPQLGHDFLKVLEEEGMHREYVEGSTILQAGSYIRSTMLVLHGLIKVYREDEEGNEFFMYYLQPGQACAISIICATKAEKSQVTAKAVEDSELLLIPFNKLEQWMNEFPSWYEFVIETYRSRFEEVLSVIDNIAFLNMDERLEFYLKRHFDQCKCNDLELTHQEIARELNSSREVISRLLKKMEQKGLIILHRNHIELKSTFLSL